MVIGRSTAGVGFDAAGRVRFLGLATNTTSEAAAASAPPNPLQPLVRILLQFACPVMAEVLEWLKPVASTPTGQVVSRSLDVIESALHVYRPEEVCFSFNGGKDSTVVFHMLRAACLRRVRADASIPDAEKASGAASLLQRVRMVYFEVEDNFPEVESFMTEVCATYGLSLQRLPPFKAGLMQLITDHGIRAVLIGTRATDPDGSEKPIAAATAATTAVVDAALVAAVSAASTAAGARAVCGLAARMPPARLTRLF